MASENMYFAQKPATDATGILLNRASKWFSYFETSGYREKLRAMYAAYHGLYYEEGGHTISFSGEQGELAQLPVNNLRNLATHMLIMTTSNRPSMEARAINNDYKSKVQTQLANGILDYYMREKRLEKYLKTAVELAIVLGSGYIKIEWDATEGEIFDYHLDAKGNPDPKQPIYDGDVKFSNLNPFDVVFDNTKESDDHDWVLIRSFKNKYDLAAKYPEQEKVIIDLPTKSDVERIHLGMNSDIHSETEDTYVYEFYHKKTNSMPNGRYLMFLTEDIVLHDVAIPYRMLPIFRIAPANILGTPFGYTPLFDVLPIQQGQNSLYSTILTNQNAFGVQNIFVKSGSNLNTTRLEGGLNIIEGMEQPVPLNLTNTPEEIFKLLALLEKAGETISGVNSVARGNTDGLGSNPSGTAMALIQSMALQFMSGLQQSYVLLIEDVGNALIKILQDYANTPRLAAIAGKNNATEMKMFSSDKLSNISRVTVDVGNALARTTAGRVQMATDIMQYAPGQITPQQYITLINTGKLESITQHLQDEDNLLSAENEALMEEEVPPVIATDDHALHIKSHRSVLFDPALRKDANLVARVNEHIQAHINEMKNADSMILGLINPATLQLLQQTMPPPPMGPDGAPAADGMAPMDVPPEGQEGMQVNPDNAQQMTAPGLDQAMPLPQPAEPPPIPEPGQQ